jgi:hypothetical protein
MSVICPYCKHKMRVKGAHAGRFTPRCDRCDKKFFLVIPSEPGAVCATGCACSIAPITSTHSAKQAANKLCNIIVSNFMIALPFP